MTPAPDPEAARLEALQRYRILDTAPEPAFNDLTALASFICGTPIALMTLVDEVRQWFKSKVGLEVVETHRAHGFCAHIILERGWLVVEDARADQRFANHPLSTPDPPIRFYAGAASAQRATRSIFQNSFELGESRCLLVGLQRFVTRTRRTSGV